MPFRSFLSDYGVNSGIPKLGWINASIMNHCLFSRMRGVSFKTKIEVFVDAQILPGVVPYI